MATHTHQYFVRGRITDGDSNDQPGDALLECINLDLDLSLGEMQPRPGLAEYVTLGAIPTIDGDPYIGTDDELPAAPNGGAWWWWSGCLWDSGITTVQSNLLVILREKTFDGWKDAYAVYSNAPFKGNGNAFALLTNPALETPYCRPIAVNGQVRVALGSAHDSMIHLNLCEEGDLTLPSTGGPAVVITDTTDVIGDSGEGGMVRQGWLWDWSKLYWSGMGTAAYVLAEDGITITEIAPATTAAALEDSAKILVALVPEYDDYDRQYSIPMIYVARAASTARHIQITIRPTALDYNKRIRGFAVYGQRTERVDRIDDLEPRRLFTITMKEIAVTASYYVTGDSFLVTEGTWGADSKGRALSLHANANEYSYLPKDADVDDEISVKPSGFMLRRKRLYAWGINGDPGQSKFAVSIPDTNDSGQLDVFYKITRIWRDGSKATVWAEEWMDRMYLWNASNSYWIDLEQRNDDQTMTLDTGYGIGTTYPRTIAKGGSALYWANNEGIYRFTSSSPVNIVEDYWMKEYRKISRARKESMVVAYNEPLDELWCAIEVADGLQNVYVYSARSNNWRLYRFFWNPATSLTTFIITGMLNTADGYFLLYGSHAGGGNAVFAFGEGTYDNGTPIAYYMESQRIGNRSTWQTPEIVTIAWDPGSLNKSLEFKIYANKAKVRYSSIFFPGSRKRWSKIRPRKVREYRFSLTGRVDSNDQSVGFGEYESPKIMQITIDTSESKMRTE